MPSLPSSRSLSRRQSNDRQFCLESVLFRAHLFESLSALLRNSLMTISAVFIQLLKNAFRHHEPKRRVTHEEQPVENERVVKAVEH